jgi:hypothetical protein
MHPPPPLPINKTLNKLGGVYLDPSEREQKLRKAGIEKQGLPNLKTSANVKEERLNEGTPWGPGPWMTKPSEFPRNKRY